MESKLTSTEKPIIRKNMGYYDLTNGIRLYFCDKPNFIRRYFMRLLFGFKWKDNE